MLRRALPLLAVIALVLTGCSIPSASSSPDAVTAPSAPLAELETLSNPRGYFGESTATLRQTNIRAITENAEPDLPVTVTDNQGTEVTVDDASRILALDIYGSLAATVYGLGLGDNLVGRDTSTGFPEAAELPLVTQNGHELNAEAILELAPTVVITDTTVGPWDVILQLREIGIPVVITDSHRDLTNVSTIVEQVAAALGVEKEGAALAERVNSEIDAKVAEIAAIAPTEQADRVRVVFLYVRGNAGIYYMFGKESGADSLIQSLGAVDVATEIDWQGMRPVNAEALVEMKPDLILMMTKGLDSVDGVDGLMERVPAVANTPAGQNRRIVDMSDYEILSFGPRTADVLDALARAIYAPEATSAVTGLAGPVSLPRPKRTRTALLVTGLSIALVITALLSVGTGQLSVSPIEVVSVLLKSIGIDIGVVPTHPNAEAALWTIRFPRVVMSLVIGAALAVAGMLMQAIFGNPLAEPGVVGVSSGAALGACSAIVFGLNFLGEWTTAVLAFGGGLVTTLIVYAYSRAAGKTEVVTLILTGIAVNAFCGAGLAFLTFIGDTAAREQIVFWQLGSLNGSRWVQVAVVVPCVLLAIAVSFFFARRLDLLSLGEKPARHLGVNVEALRLLTIVLVALLVGASVSFAGIIGFVGLVVPHLMRMIIGPAHLPLLLTSTLGGGLLLMLADLVARTAVQYADLPIGMLTSLVGGPFFFWLLRRARKRAGGWA